MIIHNWTFLVKILTQPKIYNFRKETFFDWIFQHVVEKNFIYKNKCLNSIWHCQKNFFAHFSNKYLENSFFMVTKS